MPDKLRNTMLLASIALIVVIIAGLELTKSDRGVAGDVVREKLANMSITEKAEQYDEAVEIVDPQGFINTGGKEIHIADYIGEKVVLVDFWTYSCINCQRTLPYLTEWYEKYRDAGLEIVGVHTPEFAFEEERKNVVRATEQFSVEYPVVQDNNYATWRAYGNRYWPRKYLIDIDGYIVYDHIGEGSYEETERRIQDALRERADRLGLAIAVPQGFVNPDAPRADNSRPRTPEIYFGAARNDALANGAIGSEGARMFALSQNLERDHLYLDGEWDITSEYAENTTNGARIVLPYRAGQVYIVARADQRTRIEVRVDGEPIGDRAGADVSENTLMIAGDRLYHVVDDAAWGEHTLELIIHGAGVEVFTFTFG